MRSQTNSREHGEIIGGTGRPIDIFGMLESGELPSYLPSLWKRNNLGYSPHFWKKVANIFLFPNTWGHELYCSLAWLFELSPMPSEDFPQNEKALEAHYHRLLLEMAQLVLVLRDGKEDASIRARAQMAYLYQGAEGFGFISDHEKGLKPYFDKAKKSWEFNLVDLEIWIAFCEEKKDKSFILQDPRKFRKVSHEKIETSKF
jgi:hypothetical protein